MQLSAFDSNLSFPPLDDEFDPVAGRVLGVQIAPSGDKAPWGGEPTGFGSLVKRFVVIYIFLNGSPPLFHGPGLHAEQQRLHT